MKLLIRRLMAGGGLHQNFNVVGGIMDFESSRQDVWFINLLRKVTNVTPKKHSLQSHQ